MLDFDFQKAYHLEDDRVSLLPMQMEHLEHLVKPSEDMEIWTYFLEKGNGRKKLAGYFKNALQNRILGKEYAFVVYDKHYKNMLAQRAFMNFQMNSKPLNWGILGMVEIFEEQV